MAVILSGGSRKNPFSCLFWILEAVYISWFTAPFLRLPSQQCSIFLTVLQSSHFLPTIARKIPLFLLIYMIRLGQPVQPRLTPCARFLDIILSGKSLLSCNVTYAQVPGLELGDFVEVIILPTAEQNPALHFSHRNFLGTQKKCWINHLNLLGTKPLD